MKILLIHNYYTLRGGEDAVFEQEHKLLKQSNAVEVMAFQNKSGLLGAIQFIISVYNIWAARKLQNKIRSFKPDVIHIHNWHFASGPIIVRVASSMGIPTVLTLHNFRLLCPSATLLSNGHIFLNSTTSSFPWIAIRRKLYRNSYPLTFWLAFIVWLHKKLGTWALVNNYIVLTEFSKRLYYNNSLGIQNKKLKIKPNFVVDLEEKVGRKSNFLFVGRLSNEKGIHILISAVREIKCKLLIAGAGELMNDVVNLSSTIKNVHFLGNLSANDVRKHMRRCTALVFPSIWYEGMPMTILEAFSTGTPVIASNLGNMAEMIIHGYNGLLFDAASPHDLKCKIEYWQELDEDAKATFRENARMTYDLYYSPQQNLNKLIAIYKDAISQLCLT